MLALGIRGLRRATWSREFAPRRSRPCEGAHKAIWVLYSCTSGEGWNGTVGRRVRTRSGPAAGPEALDKRGLRLSRMGPEGGAEFREVTQAGTARKPPRPLCSAPGLRELKVV